MKSRTVTAIVGILASIGISIAAWWYFDTLLIFLLVPFVPLLFRRRHRPPSVRTCPRCSFRTRNTEYEFCPRDGSRLDQSESDAL